MMKKEQQKPKVLTNTKTYVKKLPDGCASRKKVPTTVTNFNKKEKVFFFLKILFNCFFL